MLCGYFFKFKYHYILEQTMLSFSMSGSALRLRKRKTLPATVTPALATWDLRFITCKGIKYWVIKKNRNTAGQRGLGRGYPRPQGFWTCYFGKRGLGWCLRLLKLSLKSGHLPCCIKEFSLLYQGNNLFPDISGNFTLYIRIHILLPLIERGIFLAFFNTVL